MTIKESNLDYLQKIADEDVSHIKMKERTYGGSWKKRGGVGAFMMLARKWDRIEKIVGEEKVGVPRYDIFSAISQNPTGADSTTLAEIRDLRRYLMLVESEMMSEGVIAEPSVTGGFKTGHANMYIGTTGGNEEPFGFQVENEIGASGKKS